MKLTIGSIYLGKNQPNFAELSNDQGVVKQIPLEDSDPSIEDFSPYLNQVDEIVIGFVNQTDLDFLQYFPNVTRLWIITSRVKNLDGLQFLDNLKLLTIDRPTCRMDKLGELSSLEELNIDDWRPGAKSVFRLKGLVKVSIRKFGCSDLQGMSEWTRLSQLWINAGKLEDLEGIPGTIKKLRLTSLRNLQTLSALSNCLKLEDLRLASCRKINSLVGIEQCFQLKTLSIAKSGVIQSLKPLYNLKNLEYIYFADGTEVQDNNSIDVLYDLPKLQKLIITKKSGLDRNKILEVVPDCDVILAT